MAVGSAPVPPAQYRPDVRRRRRQVAPGVSELVLGDAAVAGRVTDVVPETVEQAIQIAGRVSGGVLVGPGRFVLRGEVLRGLAVLGCRGRRRMSRPTCPHPHPHPHPVAPRTRSPCRTPSRSRRTPWPVRSGSRAPPWASRRVRSGPARAPGPDGRCAASPPGPAPRPASAPPWPGAGPAGPPRGPMRLSSLARRACSFHSCLARRISSLAARHDSLSAKSVKSPAGPSCSPGLARPVRAPWRASEAAARISRRRSPAAPRTSARISAASSATDSRISSSRSANSPLRSASSARPASVMEYTLRPPSVVWVTRPSASSLDRRG